MLSIYVHIPFCLRKCHYCGFVSAVYAENKANHYVLSVEKEIELSKQVNDLHNKQVISIFFGGGTPSILSIKQLEKILQTIKKYFNVVANCETTIECNPATNIDFMGLYKIGFNRISIGVQSFNDNELQFLGRLHNSNTAENTILTAKKYFNNVSIDLIYGIPNQTLKSFEYTINTAISLDLKHISAYNLIYEENAKLNDMKLKEKLSVLDSDLEVEMYTLLCNTVVSNDFKQYEVSNFAKKDYKCKHNQSYWNRKDYIGFGIAAHSCINDVRFANTNNLEQYFQKINDRKLPIISKDILTDKDIYVEKIFLGLRSSGVDKKLLNEKQINFMKECIKLGYATETNNSFILTPQGKFITDSIVLNIFKII